MAMNMERMVREMPGVRVNAQIIPHHLDGLVEREVLHMSAVAARIALNIITIHDGIIMVLVQWHMWLGKFLAIDAVPGIEEVIEILFVFGITDTESLFQGL